MTKKLLKLWHLMPCAILIALVITGCQDTSVPSSPVAPVVPVTGIAIFPEQISVPESGTGKIGVYFTPANATNTNVTWVSKDPSVVNVTRLGSFSGISAGEIDVTAITVDGGFEASTVITVIPRHEFIEITSFDVSRRVLPLALPGEELIEINEDEEEEIVLDSKEQIVPVILPENATEKGVFWRSDNPNIATVDRNGLITAVSRGTTTVTATSVDGGLTVTIEVRAGAAAVEGTVKMTKPYDPNDPMDIPTRESIRVIQTIWKETPEDPRQVIGYQLEDGTPFFDHMVFLYGVRLRDRDCSRVTWTFVDPNAALEPCTFNGLHACHGDNNMNYFLKNWETYIKPIRDNGTKVLLSIVPQDTGAGIGNMYSSTSWTTQDVFNHGAYPFNEERVWVMIDRLAELMVTAQIDGIGFDEEYIGTYQHPTAGPRTFSGSGANMLRFCYELQDAVNRRLGAGNERELVFEQYQWGTTVGRTATFNTRPEFPGGPRVEVTVSRDDLDYYEFGASYGGWTTNVPAGVPRSRFGPASVELAGAQQSPKPPIGWAGGSGIQARMSNHLYDGFGVVMYYCLRDRNRLVYGIPEWGLPRFPEGMFGPGNDGRPEAYFSQISRMLYGQDTLFVGEDYPRRWPRQ